ncbi:ADP-forming succinate--CoA ligase subunit beta [Candidatus Pantoea edessiphila]|uniref:Succinate--CoA ligase [ADP-forming] subunit beta n=1 Tax=Candidatus Pantoea edessiphila TaxID=2044610 RepID=A0A2P5T2F2_9GAMM|nr:ADP-forming succinate--CoA ligase subunit beta [Candidatus Pantoea edessiphila]PPI88730.1 ADP-forming succinate--CoA ligase subunit beta [Candidatus Pantoea edessiphila]
MNIHEYQSKNLFSKYDIPIPKGYICSTLAEAEELFNKIKADSLVMKCQVHAGGRSKSGAVKIARNIEEIRDFFKKWLGKRLITYQTDSNGQLVNKILIEENAAIDKELYLSAVVDRETYRISFMVSVNGGVEIERIITKTPNMLYKIEIDPITGPQQYQGRELAFKLGLTGTQINQFTDIFIKLACMFTDLDLKLVEINPLIVNKSGNLICLDSKLSIDSNALFRHPEFNKMIDSSQEDPREALANKFELSYVSLKGNIGCMVNGAGLAMGTMDIIKYYGGQPANFLDVGGNVTNERVIEAFKIIISDNNIKSILVNIFGGIVRCDFIADGIINAIKKLQIKLPIIIRLEGNNSELGIKKLINSNLGFTIRNDLIEAVKYAVSAASENK